MDVSEYLLPASNVSHDDIDIYEIIRKGLFDVIIIYHVCAHANAGSCLLSTCLFGKNYDYYYVICEHKLHGWTLMLFDRLKWQAYNKCEVCAYQDILLSKCICQLKKIWQQTWWRHQIETSPALLALCAGNSLVTSEVPAQRSVTRSFDVFFLFVPE